MRIAAIGASLTQQGGCFVPQEGRCRHYAAKELAAEEPLGPTEVPKRSGWFVRFGHWLNATWPGAHQLHNAGADMTPAGGFAGCLYSILPRELDLVILEFGSMACK